MRVALIQSETRFIGGIERITESILQHEDWSGIEWFVIFLRPGMLVERIAQFLPPARVAVLDAGRLRDPLRATATVARIRSKLREWKIDAVVSQSFHAQCYGGPAARLGGAKSAFWCHSIIRPEHEEKDAIVRLALRTPMDIALTSPQRHVDDLRARLGHHCAVRLLYPAVLASWNDGDRAKVREEFALGDAPVLSIIARLQPWKGQTVFLKAAAQVAQQFPSARFLVVGGPTMPGDHEYAAELRKLAAQLGIRERVDFTGERSDVADILAASDVVVMASVEPESFGLALAEAMAAGRAVIGPNAGGPADFVEPDVSGLLTTPGDHRELAAAMARLLEDEQLRSELGRNAQEHIREKFGFEQMKTSLQNVLSEVVRSDSVK